MNTLIKINEKFNKAEFKKLEEINFINYSDFNFYRLVDPLTKKCFIPMKIVIWFLIEGTHCYDVWEK